MKALMILLAAFELAGCAEMAYDRGQDMALERCEALDIPAERTECRRRARQSFEDYSRDRRKLPTGRKVKGDVGLAAFEVASAV